MASKNEFAQYCADLFAPVGSARVRRMFGGHGLYVDDLFVAIITGESLYLKADAETALVFEKAGGTRFTYEGQSKSVSLQYWTAPAEALDSPRLMEPWARLAVEAALRARAVKPSKVKRSSARSSAKS